MFDRNEWNAKPENVAKRKKYRQERVEQHLSYSRKYAFNNPEKMLHKTAKHRALKRGVEFNIDVSDIVIPEVCPVLGIPLVIADGTKKPGGRMDSPSLDRIDNEKGYVKGNVQVISHMANSMKFTANKEQLLAFANWILKEYET
jgi:hypothetical protein